MKELNEFIQAKPTVYLGRQFRSRLEARWAVFFSEMLMDWEYEPQTFTNGKLWYLPDFWIPHLECFIEVKPKWPTSLEIEKAHIVSSAGASIYFAIGPPVKTIGENDGVMCDCEGKKLMNMLYCGTCDCARLFVCGPNFCMGCCSDPYSEGGMRDRASQKALEYIF